MKAVKLVVVGATLMSALTAHADTYTSISTRKVVVPVDISTAKVVKTNAGYGSTYLVKILVPELAGPTLMNHRNDGESAPCLATYETDNISDVIAGKPEVVNAEMEITLEKTAYVDKKDHCRVILTETINTNIHGYDFTHARSSDLPPRNEADCK